MKISDIFFVSCGERIIEENVYNHKGKIPCVTAQTTNQGITWYTDEKWLNLFHKNNIITVPCITWSKDGYAGKLFYRDYPFYPNDHCGVLIPRELFKDKINLKWFVFTQENLIKSYVTSQNTQGMLYNEVMSNIEIKLPLKSNGDFDIDKQNKLVEQYEKVKKNITTIEDKISQIDNIMDKEISFNNYKMINVEDLAILNKGSNKISEENLYINYDKYGIPVYSSATMNKGLMKKVSKECYDNFNKKGKAGELTWTTNGYAGVVFYRDTDYLYSEKCGRIIIRGIYKDKLNSKYLKIYLNQITYKYKTAESNNAKLEILHMSNIPCKLPINLNGDIDLDLQNKIVAQYEKLETIKSQLENILNKCKNVLSQ